VHHYNSTQYCSTETVFLLIFPFLQTNITSQMWPSGGKGFQIQNMSKDQYGLVRVDNIKLEQYANQLLSCFRTVTCSVLPLQRVLNQILTITITLSLTFFGVFTMVAITQSPNLQLLKINLRFFIHLSAALPGFINFTPCYWTRVS